MIVFQFYKGEFCVVYRIARQAVDSTINFSCYAVMTALVINNKLVVEAVKCSRIACVENHIVGQRCWGRPQYSVAETNDDSRNGQY